MNNYQNTIDITDEIQALRRRADYNPTIPPTIEQTHPRLAQACAETPFLPLETQLLNLPVLLPFELDQLLDDNDALIDVTHELLLVHRVLDAMVYLDKLNDNLIILLNHFEIYNQTVGKVQQLNIEYYESRRKILQGDNIKEQPPLESQPQEDLYYTLNLATFYYFQQQVQRANDIISVINLYTNPVVTSNPYTIPGQTTTTPSANPVTNNNNNNIPADSDTNGDTNKNMMAKSFLDPSISQELYHKCQQYTSRLNYNQRGRLQHLRSAVNTTATVLGNDTWRNLMKKYQSESAQYLSTNATSKKTTTKPGGNKTQSKKTNQANDNVEDDVMA